MPFTRATAAALAASSRRKSQPQVALMEAMIAAYLGKQNVFMTILMMKLLAGKRLSVGGERAAPQPGTRAVDVSNQAFTEDAGADKKEAEEAAKDSAETSKKKGK